MKGYRKVYTLPFKFDIPNYALTYIQKKSFIKIFLKYFKRFIYISLKKQSKLETNRILDYHKKILWINLSAPSLGDSLMDLSSRSLLKDRKIDLFTDKNNAHLYLYDEIFRNVYSQGDNLENTEYDLVILDSYSTRTIKYKSIISPSATFVGMYGYYNGPEVNRVLFSFHRMNQLLGYIKNENEINLSSKTSLSIAENDCQLVRNVNLPKKYISIALGGEWDYRIYNNWIKVIELLISKDQNLKIVLVGSNNAIRFSKELINQIPSKNLINCVNKFSFMQTAEIINQSELLICCDGGLMHAANALNTPILPLFARLTPKMQLTEHIVSFSLFDDEDVNNIKVSEILEEYSKFRYTAHNRPQGE